jgi:hypothetical protein
MTHLLVLINLIYINKLFIVRKYFNFYNFMNKRKREENQKKQQDADPEEDLEEAIEENMIIDEDEENASSEGEGEDLMENMER